MDVFERELARFLVCWEPYGGPNAEDAFSEFGLTPATIFERAAKMVVAAAGDARLTKEDRMLIDELRRIVDIRCPGACAVGIGESDCG